MLSYLSLPPSQHSSSPDRIGTSGVDSANLSTPSTSQQNGEKGCFTWVIFPHILFPTVSSPFFPNDGVETSLVSVGGQSGAPSVQKDAEDIWSLWSSFYYTWWISTFTLSSGVRYLIEQNATYSNLQHATNVAGQHFICLTLLYHGKIFNKCLLNGCHTIIL